MENQFKTDPEAILNFRITWGFSADYSDEDENQSLGSDPVPTARKHESNQIKAKKKTILKFRIAVTYVGHGGQ